MILVTGASGFLGKALIQHLNARYRRDVHAGRKTPPHGWKHYAYDLPNHSIIWPDPWNPQAGSLYKMACSHNGVEGDENQIRGDLYDKVEKSKVVIHLAAVADLNESEKDKDKNHRVNVEGTLNVARACAKFNKPLVFISTCCVYGTTSPGVPAQESDIPRPTEVYAESKLEAERELLDMAGKTWKFWKRNGLKLKICRMGTMYGPGMRPALFNYMALESCATGKTIEIHGNGMQSRCYLYIDDAVSGIVDVMENGLYGETYNLSGDEGITLMRTLETASALTGRVPQIKFVADRKGQIEFQRIAINKAMLLGWVPAVSYDVGMMRTWDWMRPTVDPESADFGL